MANVTRYDPFGELFDDFFKGYFVRPVGGDSRTTAPRMTVDVICCAEAAGGLASLGRYSHISVRR